jgi:hypothetical protein
MFEDETKKNLYTAENFGFLAADDHNEWECAVAND